MRKLVLFASLAAGLAIPLAAFAPSASAQRMASPGATAHFTAPAHAATPAKGPAFNGGRGSLAFRHESHSLSRFPRSGPFGSQFFPLLANWLNLQDLYPQDLSAQDLYSSGYPVASQLPFAMPGVFPGAADSAERQPRPLQESLLIELQGSRYVRVSDSPIEGGVQELTLTPEPNRQSASTRKHAAQTATHDSASQAHAIAVASPAGPLPPVVLVLRDGTCQEVHDYTIAAGVLYARGDFYTDGYWNRKIDLASLNLPETVAANSTRGVRFVLPSAPNEVITRP
ncbi:MAG: hypothetical protein WB562_08290 [Candidatus Sulfotelmatobacter sp.]